MAIDANAEISVNAAFGGVRPAGPAGRPSRGVFTIPAGQPFLATLAGALMDGRLPANEGPRLRAGPLDLADVTVLVPTRRSVKALQDAFLAVAPRISPGSAISGSALSGSAIAGSAASGRATARPLTTGFGRALLLPTIRSISQTDEDASLVDALSVPEALHDNFLAGRFPAEADGDGEELAPAIGALERRLALTRMVLAWSERAGRAMTPAQAAGSAKDLAALLDLVETEGCSLASIAQVVPDTYSAHWRQTLDFLSILTEVWPPYLASRGLTSPAARRNALIEAEARRLQSRPASPVIIAGVTGSVPSTVTLMRAVAALEHGAVVLPGLDQGLDAAAWAQVPFHPEHPQYGLAKLLAALGVDRGDVRVLAAPSTATTDLARSATASMARQRLIGEAMRPASTTDTWHVFAADPRQRAASAGALHGLQMIEAPTAQDEADAIALILRQAVEDPHRTAALVTPDRNLGRRVTVRLEEWGIQVDDSAGRPLSKTPPGVFLDHVAQTIHSGFAPGPLMALLQHPFARLGMPAAQARRGIRALELMTFRQAYIGTGILGIERALDQAEQAALDEIGRPRAVRRLRAEDRLAAREVVQRVTAAFAQLRGLWSQPGPHALTTFALAQIAAAEAVAADAQGDTGPLWQGEDGEAATIYLARLTEDGAPSIDLHPSDYADFWRSLLAGEAIRPSVALHPRLFVWGPYESRLQQPDLIVLGGLNEGVWPQSADPGAWLNRGMLKALGLPAPEERIGFLAHDFCQALAAPEVVLTRSAKVDGTPAVPSRWLLRLQALLTGLGLDDALAPGPQTPWLDWAMRRNRVGQVTPAARPEPRPPVAIRPRSLSVTAVETWLANPYAIYARHILRLDELPRLSDRPGANLRGVFLHQALHSFVKTYPQALPPDPADCLMTLLDQAMADHAAHPRVAAFWRPRFKRFAEWFAQTEAARRAGVVQILSEVEGNRMLDGPAGAFELTARADRIDVLDGGLVITDYKTGALPSNKAVVDSIRPQLALEAAIAASGGFKGLAVTDIAGLRYISARGGEPPGEERLLAAVPVELSAAAIAGLERRIAEFDRPTTPYAAQRRAGFQYGFDQYAHLARVAEWASAGDGDDEAAPMSELPAGEIAA